MTLCNNKSQMSTLVRLFVPRAQQRQLIRADEVFRAMREQAGNPPIFLLDLRPVSWPLLIVGSHDAAERVSKSTKQAPWSTPKSPTVRDILELVGPTSLLCKEVRTPCGSNTERGWLTMSTG